MKNLVKRSLALLLVLMMCMSLVNVTAFAAEDEGDSDSTAFEVCGQENCPCEAEGEECTCTGDDHECSAPSDEEENEETKDEPTAADLGGEGDEPVVTAPTMTDAELRTAVSNAVSGGKFSDQSAKAYVKPGYTLDEAADENGLYGVVIGDTTSPTWKTPTGSLWR